MTAVSEANKKRERLNERRGQDQQLKLESLQKSLYLLYPLFCYAFLVVFILSGAYEAFKCI